ncbi:alkylated DNA repair protein alkB homolog 8 [Palaemon carinicauda]|uniref:alkylated DNA repair protein alkB homolog 8 n=1 Tax=Palaemon carinicauda TaxID=392227 RepID=UPI0035B6A66D
MKSSVMKQEPSKVKRKIGRCLTILQKDYPDIQSSEEPTKFVFIGNAGLTTNADEVCITELITAIGSGLQAVTLIPGKSYSFASFSKEEEALVIVSAANGLQTLRGSGTPLYMTFVDRVPSVSSSVSYEHPPGLELIEEFISPEEEALLLRLIDWDDRPNDKAEGSVLKHRQVRHFGYEFKYGANSVDKDRPLAQGIPEELSAILDRIVEKGIMPQVPDQMTVNRYLPGQGIPSHVDTHCSFTDEVLSLSVGSGIMMDFRYAAGANAISSQYPSHCAVYLKPRSLCAMKGSSRYEWTHGICPRMTDVIRGAENDTGLRLCPRQERVSFTFRKVRHDDCHCGNKLVCDSPSFAQEEVNGEDALKLEKEHVLAVYDQIADHFSDTRHKPWPQVLEFVGSLPPGSFLLDVGCGNGKYLGHNKSIFELGCDTSVELTKICKDRNFEVLNCNCLQLPYRSSLFDAAICIAVIHHLASEERRRAAVQEIVRVLCQGGRGLIYVWALEQKRGKKKSAYLKQNRANRREDSETVAVGSNALKLEGEAPNSSNLPVHTNRTEFVEQDMLVPWKLKPQKKLDKENTINKNTTIPNLLNLEAGEKVPVFHRFYHVFKQSELETLCEAVEGVRILKSYYDEGNWCVIFEKTL